MSRLVKVVFVIALLACRDTPNDERPVRQAGYVSGDSIEWIEGDTAHVVDPDDWEVLSARSDARATLAEFVRRFREPPTTQSRISVKVRLAERNSAAEDSLIEHLWLDPLDVRDSTIRGVLVNTPFDLRRARRGDTVSVPFEQVSDWYAVDRDTLVGGFTTRLFRSHLTKAARDTEDAHRPYTIVGGRTEEYLRLKRGR